MDRLSDDAKDILDIVRDADNPTDRDRRRLAGAMAVRLGAAAMVSTATVGVSSSVGAGAGAAAAGVGSATAGAGVVTKVLVSMALAGAVGGGVALHHARAPMRSSVVMASRKPIDEVAPPPRVEPTPLAERRAVVEITTPEPAIEPPHAVVASRAKERTQPSAPSRLYDPAPPVEKTSRADMLAREVSVLASARAALLDHEPARALALLDANSATFAAGMLREEFLVARILALRDLGRTVEANALAAKFAKEMSHSPLAAELTPESAAHSKDAHDH
jgi:hypothetical protein